MFKKIMDGVKTSKKILDYIGKNGQASGNELANYLEISDRAVRKQLKTLLESDKISRIGKPPKVFYLIKSEKVEKNTNMADKDVKIFIDKNYLIITPSGERKEGWEGFVYWCQKTNRDIARTSNDYIALTKKHAMFRGKDGLIDGNKKIKKTFPKIYLDHLFYIDFYSIEIFGKTKLGQLLLYAKQSQNKKLIKEISLIAKKNIDNMIKKYKIDGIGFIPPTVRREVQFMKELRKNINVSTRVLKITKVKSEVSVPQKTLNKLEDRIENAQKTIVVEDNSRYKNILLVDDAVGSGATINETARKIREKGICKGVIIGLAITGSFKGFDIISEV